ncbi:protein of unknown function [Methylacidimicrobium sp. AP8]|nr:hypothetical protein [Methylacidimicrobium sp. AP8]CAB4242411.1 protein of unknown function [Methylacidimicrobium sp. AP8]
MKLAAGRLRMLDQMAVMVIRVMRRQGKGIREIARELAACRP